MKRKDILNQQVNEILNIAITLTPHAKPISGYECELIVPYHARVYYVHIIVDVNNIMEQSTTYEIYGIVDVGVDASDKIIRTIADADIATCPICSSVIDKQRINK